MPLGVRGRRLRLRNLVTPRNSRIWATTTSGWASSNNFWYGSHAIDLTGLTGVGEQSGSHSGYAPSRPVHRLRPNRFYYGSHGYGNNSNGSTDGYPPFDQRNSVDDFEDRSEACLTRLP